MARSVVAKSCSGVRRYPTMGRVAIRLKNCIFCFVVLLILWPGCFASRATRRPFSIKDSIEATNVLYLPGSEPAFISPDGKKYVVVLYRGDVSLNGNWVTLLSGNTTSLRAACHPRVAARLFSRSTARASDLVKNLRWLSDNERVVFLWDSGQRPPGIVSIDVRTGQVQSIVDHPTPIVAYDISSDGRTIIFLAQSRQNEMTERRLERTGFSVTDQSVWSLLQGNPDGWTPWSHYETFTLSPARGRVRGVREAPALWSIPPELLRLSPNAHYAISVEPARNVPISWGHYTEHVFANDYLPAARRNPAGPHLIRQYEIIDLDQGVSHPLWDAPEYPLGRVVWSPDSRELAVGPTFLPLPQSGKMGLEGKAVAVIDQATGSFDVLPVPESLAGSNYRPLLWMRDGVIELGAASGDKGRDAVPLDFKKMNGEWQRIPESDQIGEPASPVRVELREDANSPPALYAKETATGSVQLIMNLDPQLRTSVELGQVKLVHWRATDGTPWSGMLYYPVHFQPGHQFPLVIQTHGYSPDRFSLDGAFSTAFAAQALANRDIAVLQIGGPDAGDDNFLATPKEPEVFMSGIIAAAQHFVDNGLADRARVGMVGFSRTGWLVEYTLTHSDFPFAAAEVADNIDVSYVQYALGEEGLKSEYESDIGAPPFGEGLKTWVRSAPGFNCDRIRAPLRLEVDSGPIEAVLGHWEIFSNLRRLGKPVELFVVPDIEHGSHVLGNPAQRLASQGGTVDWFCFWLKGEEDPSPAKSLQYARWRRLRMLGKQSLDDQ